MQSSPTASATHPVFARSIRSQKRVGAHYRIPDRKHAIEEIGAYITIRDGLLAEVQKSATTELIRRLSVANDFVESCLGEARPPYEAQFLPEINAAQERERCSAIKDRIAKIGRRK
jgi:hypothetical protein